jgi:expansin (peptidoglycan-binding protein)
LRTIHFFLFGLGMSLALAAGCGGSDGGGGDTTGGGGNGAGSATGSGAGSTSSGGPVTTCGDQPSFTGDGTFYGATGAGACSFDPSPNDLMVGAMNAVDWNGSAPCGACAHLKGPKGEVTIRVVDLCPECKHGDIDLSEEAFAKIADPVDGRVTINWQYVPCDVQGPIVYHFKEGSNQWWTAVQIRNHRHPIAKFEWRSDDGAWHEVQRLDYNYFVEDKGMGPGPYTLRVTDTLGHVLEDTGIPFKEAGDSPGKDQFPACN